MKTFLKKCTKKTVAGIAGFVLLASGGLSVPARAHAFLGFEDIVFDPANLIQMVVDWGIQYAMNTLTDSLVQKEIIWDTIANTVAKAALQSMAQSMSNWVASGFDGSPTFVTNYRNHMLQVQDGAVEGYMQQLLSDGRVQSPFFSSVAQDARNSYYQNTGTGAISASRNYTLQQTCANDAAFLSGDFMQCGLSGLFSVVMQPGNSPVGSRLLTTDALYTEARTASRVRNEELGWGSGFLPAQNCGGEGTTEGEGEGTEGEGAEGEVSLSEASATQNCATRTPSSVVAHSANKFFVDLGVDIGVSADEIDELIANFFVNLITDSLQGDGGLASGSAGTGRPALDGGGPTGPTGPRSCESIPTTGAAASPSAVNAIKLSIDNLKLSVKQFQERWVTIEEEAEKAKTKLLSCGAVDNYQGTNPTQVQLIYDRDVLPALERGESSLSRSTEALTKLEEFRIRAEAAKNGQESFERLACEFQEFQGSGITPTPSEIIYAAQQSTELPDELEPNLFTKFKNISERSCAQINLSGGD